ncbi:hypothetical protein JZ751_029363 [Albula glossodonta]|uniref:Protein Spindly n=1 Tax=Albula glossodonta TaxID=121402 RepID=A0A8T2P923_9TELE|nr:hypothetical protein JZ751_029363 [Albula glossodonta]
MFSTGNSSEVQRLQCKLKEAEESLQKAAQYGLQLLDGHLDLQNQLEEQRIEMTNSIEALEQEKYSLQREVELKGRMLDSLRSECDVVKGQQKLLWDQQETQLERKHTLELIEYKNKAEQMKVELEEARLNERQLKHKLELQTEALRDKTEELRALTDRAQETMSAEVLELQVEKAELECAKTALQEELQEAQYKEQQLQLATTNLQRQMEQLREEKEEREKEAVSCFNALEKAREANQMLQIQLDQMMQQAQDPNSRGNSLFAEVQIATLMQLQGSRVDPGQLERLQSMLSEKNSEIETLMMKLRRLEKVEMTVKAQPSCAPAVDTDSNDGTYYTDLLKMQLSNSVKDAERLGDELSMQRIKALSESQRVLEMERKLFSAERALKHCQSDNIKLQVKLDEFRLKYEPNDVNKSRVQKRRREKFLVDGLPDGSEQKEDETRTVEMDPSAWVKEELREEPQPSTAERLPVTPLQPVQIPEPSPQLPRDSKCVRISEEPPITIPSPPRSPPVDCKIKTEEAEVTMVTESENRRADRKKQVKSQGAIHVASERTMENQCQVPRSYCSGLKAALFLWLLSFHFVSANYEKTFSALTVIENSEASDSNGEAHVDDEVDPEDLEVFQPTDQWQTLRPGQAVPAGSHVRLNLQTGQREVKQGEEGSLKYWSYGKRKGMVNTQASSFTAQELKKALKKFKEEGVEPTSKDKEKEEAELRAQYRPIEELKRDMAQLEMLVETDFQIISRLIAKFNHSSSTADEKVAALLDLEYLVHQVDNAQDLVSMGGLKLVEAVEGGALQKLLTLLATERPMGVKKKLLFAVGSLLRHFPYAQSHFLRMGGVQVLGELFRESGSGALRVRVVTLIYDMIIEKELISQSGLDPIPDSSHQERLRQYAQISLLPLLAEQGWCNLVPELLTSPDHDWREKALRTLLAMMPNCQPQYRQNQVLTHSLSTLQEQYEELALSEQDLGEEDGYFGEILGLLNSVLLKVQ